MTPQEAILKECAEAKQKITESLINRIWRNNSTLIYSGSTEARIILDALERQIPEKPNVSDGFYRYYLCPACEHSLVAYTWEGGIHYCHCCGQAIDWSDADE